jgi:hypothetical protein
MKARTELEALVFGPTAHGPMLATCPVPGCARLTMGGTSVEHDEPVTETFPRGRPFTHQVALATDERVVARV